MPPQSSHINPSFSYSELSVHAKVLSVSVEVVNCAVESNVTPEFEMEVSVWLEVVEAVGVVYVVVAFVVAKVLVFDALVDVDDDD